MYRESQMTFLDTPGHNDFSCEMERTLQVLDYAMFLLFRLRMVYKRTQKQFGNYCKLIKFPTFIFVNKIDSTYSTKEQLLQNIQKS